MTRVGCMFLFVRWLLDRPLLHWMNVGWAKFLRWFWKFALDERWMEAFLPAEMSPLPIAENLTISQGFLKKLFLCLSRRTYWVVRGESSAHKNCSSGYCLVRLTGREQICTPFVHMTIEATKNDRSDYVLARTVAERIIPIIQTILFRCCWYCSAMVIYFL